MALALVQFAPRKGDVEANFERIKQVFGALLHDRESFPDVIVFPEASLSGYFVEGGVRDVAQPANKVVARLQTIAAAVCGKEHAPFDVVLGFYEDDGGKLYNSALYATIAKRPQLHHVHRKLFLPTYGVFDEERFVSRGRGIDAFDTPHGRAAILICEDACHSLCRRRSPLCAARKSSTSRAPHRGEAWKTSSRPTSDCGATSRASRQPSTASSSSTRA